MRSGVAVAFAAIGEPPETRKGEGLNHFQFALIYVPAFGVFSPNGCICTASQGSALEKNFSARSVFLTEQPNGLSLVPNRFSAVAVNVGSANRKVVVVFTNEPKQ